MFYNLTFCSQLYSFCICAPRKPSSLPTTLDLTSEMVEHGGQVSLQTHREKERDTTSVSVVCVIVRESECTLLGLSRRNYETWSALAVGTCLSPHRSVTMTKATEFCSRSVAALPLAKSRQAKQQQVCVWLSVCVCVLSQGAAELPWQTVLYHQSCFYDVVNSHPEFRGLTMINTITEQHRTKRSLQDCMTLGVHKNFNLFWKSIPELSPSRGFALTFRWPTLPTPGVWKQLHYSIKWAVDFHFIKSS